MLPPSFASSLPSSTGLNAAFAPFANHPVPPVTGKSHSNSLLETLGKNISVSKILCDAKVLRFHWQSGTLDKKRGFLERFFPFKTRTHVQVYISLLNYSLFISPSCTLPFNSISFHLPIYNAFLQPTFVSGLSIKTSTLWQRSFTFFTRSSWGHGKWFSWQWEVSKGQSVSINWRGDVQQKITSGTYFQVTGYISQTLVYLPTLHLDTFGWFLDVKIVNFWFAHLNCFNQYQHRFMTIPRGLSTAHNYYGVVNVQGVQKTHVHHLW